MLPLGVVSNKDNLLGEEVACVESPMVMVLMFGFGGMVWFGGMQFSKTMRLWLPVVSSGGLGQSENCEAKLPLAGHGIVAMAILQLRKIVWRLQRNEHGLFTYYVSSGSEHRCVQHYELKT